MLSRALSLATVTLLIGCLTAVAVRAVENLEAGKSPAQIFAGTCNACHKCSARPVAQRAGLLAVGLPAPALHHLQRHGLGACVLPRLQRRDRYAAPSRAKEAKQGKDGDAKDGKKEAARAGGAAARRQAAGAPAAPGRDPNRARSASMPEPAIDEGQERARRAAKSRRGPSLLEAAEGNREGR